MNIIGMLASGYEALKTDIQSIRARDPAAVSDWEVALLYSGFHAVMAHRLAHFLHNKGLSLTARGLSQLTKFFTGIEIHPAAKIGKGLFIDHGSGVVIGETAEIGDNCTIYQGVTLGGTGKECGKRHPTLGDNVTVGAGAKVLGPFRVGSGSKIAAGAVVLKEIPENSTAVGIPARVVRIGDQKVNDLDQIHMPDPVAAELARLQGRIAALEALAGVSTSETPDPATAGADTVPAEAMGAMDPADTTGTADTVGDAVSSGETQGSGAAGGAGSTAPATTDTDPTAGDADALRRRETPA